MTKNLLQIAVLHSKAYRFLRADVSKMLAPFALSLSEWSIVSLLAQNPQILSSEIANTLGVELPLVTNLVNALETRKLILKGKGLQDHRQRTLTLTPTGKSIAKKVQKHLAKKLALYFSDVPQKNIDTYISVMEAIVKKRVQ